MPITCAIALNTGSYTAGQTPPPMATLVVANSGAASVVVTGVQMQVNALNATTPGATVPAAPMVPPTGPGMTVVVPAAGSITIGPFSVAVPSAAAGPGVGSVPPLSTTPPINPQGSQPLNQVVMVGALVFGSDGSVSQAVAAPLLVSPANPPPPGTFGGVLQLSAPSNSGALLPMGAL